MVTTSTSADLNGLPLDALYASIVAGDHLDRLIELALAEDLGDAGDVTTASLVAPEAMARAAIVARAEGVIAGMPVVDRILACHGIELSWSGRWRDGVRCVPGDTLLEISGPLAILLPLERTMLNFLGRLCGIATLTRRYVDALGGTKAKLCCTRKTTPGWRALEKYAVRCGGGWLHRIGLHDAMLVKDNHLGGVATNEIAAVVDAAARSARRRHALRFVEVEVDTLAQLDAILSLDRGVVDIVLLDNFPENDLREAVRRRDARAATSGGRVELEASGGVRIERLRAIADTGVDRISCGAITHSATSLDVALDLL